MEYMISNNDGGGDDSAEALLDAALATVAIKAKEGDSKAQSKLQAIRAILETDEQVYTLHHHTTTSAV